MKEDKFSLPVSFYILILFSLAVISGSASVFLAIFVIFWLMIPVNAVITGVIAGRKLKKRWFLPLLMPLLLFLIWQGPPNYYDSLDTFGAYFIRRILYAMFECFGKVPPDFSEKQLFLMTAGALLILSSISMLISAAITAQKAEES